MQNSIINVINEQINNINGNGGCLTSLSSISLLLKIPRSDTGLGVDVGPGTDVTSKRFGT